MPLSPSSTAGRLTLPASLAAFALLAGCSHAGSFVWVDDLPQSAAPQASPLYAIAPNDLLSIRIWNQDSMSTRVRVRSDGRISLLFLGDVEVAGYTPATLAQQLETRLKDFIVKPVIAISVEESRPFTVSVTGEVARPGVYPLSPDAGVLSALAAAGGLTEYAGREDIYVLRPGSQPPRIRFRYQALACAEGAAGAFKLKDGDVLVVE